LDNQYYPIQGEYEELVADYQRAYREASNWGCAGTVCCSSGISAMVCYMPLVGMLLCALGANALSQTCASESGADSLYEKISVKALQEKNAVPSNQLTLSQFKTAVKITRVGVIVKSPISFTHN